MKNILILGLAAATMCSCNSQKYVITGDIAGLAGTVYMFDSKENVIDSATVENGSFRFTGTAAQPDVRYLADTRGDAPASFSVMLFVEPGTILVADNEQTPNSKKVSGTPSNDASAAYAAASRTLIEAFRDPATTDERRAAIEMQYDSLARATVDANRNNYFGAMLLVQQVGYGLTGQEVIDQIAKFSPEMQQTEIITTFKQSAEQKLKTEIGQPYIDIEQNNAEGTPVSLKSVIETPANKYTLVDFWASWCGPCMGEIPHLKKTYDAFHNKGFEIYGVSFDQDRDKWIGAVKEHGMNWIQVSDVKGFENQSAKDYAVQGIPSNFLIDAQGKIVAANLRGEALYEKVAALLAE